MDKIKTLNWYWQLMIVAFLGFTIAFLVRYLYTGGIQEETVKITDEVSQLKSKNQAAEIATQRINEFRSLYANKSQEYDELKVLLPEEREITNVLQGLQDATRDSRLILSRFSPKEDTAQDFIMAKPVEVEVDSNFNNLRTFFEKMAKLQRIVSITDFSLKQLDKQTSDKTLHAQFLLTAYYASAESMNNVTPAKPAVPGQPAPAGQPPANGQPATAQPASAPPAQPAPAVAK
jgi:type IV pilus assembly protein PilO